MRLLVELSGEHPTLPRAEALAAMAAERVDVQRIVMGPQILRLDVVGPFERAIARLGLAHTVSEEIATGDFDWIRKFARETDLNGRTFRVRARGLGVDVDVREVEGALGADFGCTGRVDLEHPNLDFRLLVADEFVLGRVMHRVDRSRFETRKVARRPFSLPISLHPKYARAVVNLARVPMGGSVLDPFSGTGGILLEAAEIGLRAVGTDRSPRMVKGARGMLRQFRLDADVGVADAGCLPIRSATIRGIATDPPYGRAASTEGEPVGHLYERAFDAFAGLLPPGGHAAVVLPNERAIEIGAARLRLLETHALRVHRSLVRHFCVFVKG